jgi:hypothetical protein
MVKTHAEPIASDWPRPVDLDEFGHTSADAFPIQSEGAHVFAIQRTLTPPYIPIQTMGFHTWTPPIARVFGGDKTEFPAEKIKPALMPAKSGFSLPQVALEF